MAACSVFNPNLPHCTEKEDEAWKRAFVISVSENCGTDVCDSECKDLVTEGDIVRCSRCLARNIDNCSDLTTSCQNCLESVRNQDNLFVCVEGENPNFSCPNQFSDAAVAGLVVGCIVVATAIGLLLWYFLVQKRKLEGKPPIIRSIQARKAQYDFTEDMTNKKK